MIRTRKEWGATVPTGPPQGQADELWLHWTVTRPTADADADMRTVERIGKQRFGRFSYSYCYHPPTRQILEGAGRTIGAHTSGHNTRGIAISVIGMPGHDHMPHLVEDIAAAYRHLVAIGHLKPGSPIRGHRDQKATECPGSVVYAAIPAIRKALAATPKPPPAPPTPQPEEIPVAIADDLTRRLDTLETHQRITRQWIIDQQAADAQRDRIIVAWAAQRLGATEQDIAELRAQLDALRTDPPTVA